MWSGAAASPLFSFNTAVLISSVLIVGRAGADEKGTLFVGGLSDSVDEDSLNAAFSKFGSILAVDVIRDRETRVSRGFGFVTYANPGDAKVAMAEMNGKELDGRTITVNVVAGRGGSGCGYGFGRGRGGGGSRGGGRGGGYRGGRGR